MHFGWSAFFEEVAKFVSYKPYYTWCYVQHRSVVWCTNAADARHRIANFVRLAEYWNLNKRIKRFCYPINIYLVLFEVMLFIIFKCFYLLDFFTSLNSLTNLSYVSLSILLEFIVAIIIVLVSILRFVISLCSVSIKESIVNSKRDTSMHFAVLEITINMMHFLCSYLF